MSDGSMNYICYRVEEAAGMCADVELADILRDAAKVLRDQELWLSYDRSEDTYRKSLAEFKAKWFGGNRAERIKGYVDAEIKRCRKQCYSIIGSVMIDDVPNVEDWEDSCDTREKLEEDIKSRFNPPAQPDGEYAVMSCDPTTVFGWLDRQAAITTRECTDVYESGCEACRRAQKRKIAELQEQVEKLEVVRHTRGWR